jgi:sigma-B regulation protein RsbU (phosphoserine phosphatase)
MTVMEYFISARFLFISFLVLSYFIYKKMEYSPKLNLLLNGLLIVLLLSEILSLLGLSYLTIMLHLGFIIAISVLSVEFSSTRIRTNLFDDAAIIILCSSVVDVAFKVFPFNYSFYLRYLLIGFIAVYLIRNLIRDNRIFRRGESIIFNYCIIPVLLLYHLVMTFSFVEFSFIVILPVIYTLSLALGIISVYYRHRDLRDIIKKQSDDIALAFGFTRTMRNEISSSGSHLKVLESMLTSSIRAISADGGAVYIFDDNLFLKKVSDSGDYISIYEIDNFRNERPEHENVLTESLANGQAFYSCDNYKDKRCEVRKYSRMELLAINSIIIMPMKTSEKYYGVFVYQKNRHGENFSDSDYHRAETFADFAAIAVANMDFHKEILLKNEIEKEISIAAGIQKKLLPKKFGLFENCIVEGYTKPARGISGDYFDFFHIGGGKLGFVICDVAGKGVPASLVAVIIRTIIHIIKDRISSSATILNYANRGLTGHVGIDRYATMSSLIIDGNSGQIDYSNAGHHPCILCRSNKPEIEEIEAEGFPVGITTEKKYKSISLYLNRGDRMLFYTDGVSEAMNTDGVQFSVNRLKTIVNDCRHLSPSEIVSHIRSEVDRFSEGMPQHDDQTVVLIEFLS